MQQGVPFKRATKLTEIMDTLMESIESSCRIKKVEAEICIYWLGAGAFSLDCGYCARTLGGMSGGLVHLGAERAVEWAVRWACFSENRGKTRVRLARGGGRGGELICSSACFLTALGLLGIVKR